MQCDCCERHKADTVGRESTLVPPVVIMLCHACAGDNHEPRWAVILADRAGKDVHGWTDAERFCGDPIKVGGDE